jgi:DNA-binding response OmpR family regulator
MFHISSTASTDRIYMDMLQSHILYIEDHEDTRELVTFVLADSNYKVTTTASSKEALRLARQQHFDLYLLDSWLPDGSGIELCKQLREFDRDTPIMFLSAAAYETDKQAAMDSGAQRYLVKPDDIRALSIEVEALIAFANKRQAVGSRPTDFLERASPVEGAMRSSVLSLESTATKLSLAPTIALRNERLEDGSNLDE